MAKQKSKSQAQQQKSRAEQLGAEDVSTNEKQVLNSTNATVEEANAVSPDDERGGEGNFNVSSEETLKEREEDAKAAESSDAQDDKKVYPTHWQSNLYSGGQAPQNATIIKQNDEVTFDGEKVGNMVVVKQDVYREVYPHNSKRPTYLLVYAAGTQIPEATLESKRGGTFEASDDNEDNE